MQEAEMDMTAQAFQENPQAQRNSVFVEFHIHPKQNAAKTLDAGRPIYDDVEYIRKQTPGDKDNIVDRPARPADKMEFPIQYAAFKNGQTDPVTSGTPLKIWPIVTRSLCEELAYFKIYTVEQLAEVSDSNLSKFMGGTALRQRARDFLEAAKSDAPLSQLRAEVEKKDLEIADLNGKLTLVLARLEKLEKNE